MYKEYSNKNRIIEEYNYMILLEDIISNINVLSF